MCFTLPPCPTSRGCLFATFRLRGGEASFCPTAYLLAKRTMARSSTDLRLRLRLDHRHGGIAHPRLRGSNVRCLCELAGGVNMTCQCRNSTKRFSKRQGQNIRDQEPIFEIVSCLNQAWYGSSEEACVRHTGNQDGPHNSLKAGALTLGHSLDVSSSDSESLD